MKKANNLTLLFLGLLIVACKKETPTILRPTAEDSHNFTGCRIKQIVQQTPGYSGTYNYFYREDGRVSRVRVVFGSAADDYSDKYFSYYGNTIIETTFYSKDVSPSNRDSLIVDDSDRVIAIYHNNRNNYDEFQYDSAGTVLTGTYHFDGDITSQTFRYDNGDLAWNTFYTGYFDYYYDTRPYKTGNTTATIDNMIRYGRKIIPPSMHLCSYKVHTPYADTVTFTHTTDVNGNLISEQYTEGASYNYTTNITYECK